jgi:hypothetical protein
MFEAIQILAKVVIIAAILLVAAFAALRVWRADIDLRALVSPQRAVERSAGEAVSWIPTRDASSLYQNGQVVGAVEGISIDEAASTLRFAKVSRALGLDVGKEFEFQKWRLKFERADSEATIGGLAMQPDRAFGSMVCRIVGTRGAF